MLSAHRNLKYRNIETFQYNVRQLPEVGFEASETSCALCMPQTLNDVRLCALMVFLVRSCAVCVL
jgi:hypothetical protein